MFHNGCGYFSPKNRKYCMVCSRPARPDGTLWLTSDTGNGGWADGTMVAGVIGGVDVPG